MSELAHQRGLKARVFLVEAGLLREERGTILSKVSIAEALQMLLEGPRCTREHGSEACEARTRSSAIV